MTNAMTPVPKPDAPGVIVRCSGATVVSIIEQYIAERAKEERLSHISTLRASAEGTRAAWRIKAGAYPDSPKDVTFWYDWTVEELGDRDVRVTFETRASDRTKRDLWVMLGTVAFVLSGLYGVLSKASPTPWSLGPLWASVLLASVLCLIVALLLIFLTSRDSLRSPFHSSETDRFLRALFEGVRTTRDAERR